VNGLVFGRQFAARDSIGVFGTEAHGAAAGVIITDTVVSCAFVEQNAGPGNTNGLLLLVNSTSAPSPGTYKITYPLRDDVWADYVGSCISTLEDATGGTITLTTVDSNTVSGTFDVSFPKGDHLTGAFSAPVCAGALTALTNPAPSSSVCLADN
jgi:hypothetical protein